jgi:hypothetical protein
MPSAPPAGHDGPQLNSRGLTWEPVMSTGMTAMMVRMQMRMADEEEEASQANDGSTQNVED